MFDSLTVFFYLKDKSLQLYEKKLKDNYLQLDFPPQVVANLEIKDKDKFKKLLVTWLSESKLQKHRALIVLSEEVVFTKTVALDDQQTYLKVENFLNEIPFEVEKVAKTYWQGDSGLILTATNKEIYQGVILAGEELGWEILAVVPSTVWGNLGEVLQIQQVQQILQNKELLKTANFLTPPDFTPLLTKPETDKEDEKVLQGDSKPQDKIKKESVSKKIWWITLAITLLVVGLVGVVLSRDLLKAPVKKDVSEATVPAITPTVTVAPNPVVEVGKDQLKVEVLNGTGTVGQAVKVKDLLTQLGFINIEVGNAQEKVADAVVIFSSRVSQDIQDEVLQELEKTFTKVWARTGEIEVDIQITTGKYK